MTHTRFLSRTMGGVSSLDIQATMTQANGAAGCGRHALPSVPIDEIRILRNRSRSQLVELWQLVLALACVALFALRAPGQTSHTIQISNDADDGYYNSDDGSGWHADPQIDGADLVGSGGGISSAWVIGYRFPSTGINSGDTVRSAYLEVVSSDGFATSFPCGAAPCPDSGTTFRVYGVAQDDGPSFSNGVGNTPLDVPDTTSYDDYMTTGPGDDTGSCQGNNNGQNTCIHIIDVTNIVKEITSRPGWTNTSAMRFVLLSTSATSNNVYAGFEDSSANAARAATLLVNPSLPTVVSSGGWGTSAQTTYPTTYVTGPFVYPNASTLLLFLGDYYNFYAQTIGQPTVTDSCGNGWNILAGPTDWLGIIYDQRSTVYYVQNPLACPAGDTITVNVPIEEPIFLHFLALAGSNNGSTPVASAVSSPAPDTDTTTAPTAYVTLGGAGLLVNWIFGDADSGHDFIPQAGFTTDLDSTPNYLTAVIENVPSSGSYQNTFNIMPDADGWQTVLVGVPAATGTAGSPTVTVTPSVSSMISTQILTLTVILAETPTPTGTVALTGGGYTSTTTTLTSGSAAINIPSGSLSAGTDTLTVEYSPDAASSSTYNSATGTTTITVTSATPTVTVTPGASSVTTTQPLIVTVALSAGAGSPAPTGTVVLSGASYTSAATTLSSGSATVSIPSGTLSSGIYTFQASYTPDTNSSGIYNLASGTASSQVTVTAATPMVTVTPSPSSISATQALNVTVAVSGGLGNPSPTGSVTLSGGGYTSAATTLSGGSATINVSAGSLPLGTDTLTASYTPDTNGFLTYNSASGSGPVTVSKTTASVTVSPSQSSITTTQPTAVTVTVAGTPTPTGSVTLTSGNYTSASTTLISGSALINIPAGSLSTGTDTLTATYTPDSGSSSTYSSTTGTSSETVTATTPTVTVTPGTTSVSTAQALNVTVAISGGAGNPTPTGSVTLSGNGYTSAATALSGGSVTINIPGGKLSSGNYAFNANYTPDSSSSPIYTGASGTASSSVSVTVTTPTVTVIPGASSITTTQPLSVTVAVDGGTGNPPPMGSVTLACSGYTSAATTLTGGTATINIPAGKLSAGSYMFSASYTSDSNSSSIYSNASGTASSAVIVSTTAPAVTVTPGVSSISTTQPLTVTVTVGAGLGNPTATGSVIVSGGSYTSAATALIIGTATINIPANTLSAESYTFKANYTPDSTSSSIYAPASGTASTEVNVTAPTFTMSATAVTVAPGGSVSSTVTVSSSDGYAGTIMLTCAITAEPAEATDLPTCSSGQLTLSSTATGGTVSAIVSTTATTATLVRPKLGPGRAWAGGGGAVLAVVLFFWLPIRQKRWRAMLGVVICLALLGGLSACGSGVNNNNIQNSNSGTTAGSYTITITGIGSDVGKTTATTTFVLTVS